VRALVVVLALLSGPVAACPLPGPALQGDGVQLAWQVDGPAIGVGRMFALQAQVCPPTVRLERVDATMPEHQHGMNYRPRLLEQEAGRWRADGLMFHMAGRWELRFDVVEASGRRVRLLDSITLP
jgi:hypothetical protein